MNRNLLGLSIAAVLGAGLALSADSEVPAAAPTGIYTSLKAGERSGDLVGMEMFVMRGATGLYGVLQGSEGAPGNPIALPLRVAGDAVRFVVPPDCGCGLAPGEYTARLSRSEAIVRGPGSFGERRLPRAASYWQAP